MPPAAAPIWRRLIARRRYRALLALVLLAIAIRAVLPTILRRVVVAQADEAMVGRIEIDDVDLALLTGGFTLHGLRVFTAEAVPAGVGEPVAPDATAPRAGEGPPGSAPVLSVEPPDGRSRLPRVSPEDRRGAAHRARRRRASASTAPKTEHSCCRRRFPPPNRSRRRKGPAGASSSRASRSATAVSDSAISRSAIPLNESRWRCRRSMPAQLALLITESGVEPGKIFLDAGIQDGTLHLEADARESSRRSGLRIARGADERADRGLAPLHSEGGLERPHRPPRRRSRPPFRVARRPYGARHGRTPRSRRAGRRSRRSSSRLARAHHRRRRHRLRRAARRRHDGQPRRCPRRDPSRRTRAAAGAARVCSRPRPSRSEPRLSQHAPPPPPSRRRPAQRRRSSRQSRASRQRRICDGGNASGRPRRRRQQRRRRQTVDSPKPWTWAIGKVTRERRQRACDRW